MAERCCNFGSRRRRFVVAVGRANEAVYIGKQYHRAPDRAAIAGRFARSQSDNDPLSRPLNGAGSVPRPDTVHEAGVSVRGRVAANETDVPDEKLEDFIVSWPGKVPVTARKGRVKA